MKCIQKIKWASFFYVLVKVNAACSQYNLVLLRHFFLNNYIYFLYKYILYLTLRCGTHRKFVPILFYNRNFCQMFLLCRAVQQRVKQYFNGNAFCNSKTQILFFFFLPPRKYLTHFQFVPPCYWKNLQSILNYCILYIFKISKISIQTWCVEEKFMILLILCNKFCISCATNKCLQLHPASALLSSLLFIFCLFVFIFCLLVFSLLFLSSTIPWQEPPALLVITITLQKDNAIYSRMYVNMFIITIWTMNKGYIINTMLLLSC